MKPGVDDNPDQFKSYLAGIELAINDMGPQDFTDIAGSDLSEIYPAMRNIVLSRLTARFPHITSTVIPNRAESLSTSHLIAKALNTGESTGILLDNFFQEQEYEIGEEDQIIETIKPFVRNLLRFNIDFNRLTSTFSKTNYTKGLAFDENGQVVITGPSYLNTAKILSEQFEDEVELIGFKNRYFAVWHSLKTQCPENDSPVLDYLARYVVCNPPEQSQMLTRKAVSSTIGTESPNGPIIKDFELAERINMNILMLLLSADPNGDNMNVYLKITSVLDRYLDSLIVDCPLKDTINELKSQGSFYPAIMSVDRASRTIGCPGYFHNIALRYVAKGLHIHNVFSKTD